MSETIEWMVAGAIAFAFWLVVVWAAVQIAEWIGPIVSLHGGL